MRHTEPRPGRPRAIELILTVAVATIAVAFIVAVITGTSRANARQYAQTCAFLAVLAIPQDDRVDELPTVMSQCYTAVGLDPVPIPTP